MVRLVFGRSPQMGAVADVLVVASHGTIPRRQNSEAVGIQTLAGRGPAGRGLEICADHGSCSGSSQHVLPFRLVGKMPTTRTDTSRTPCGDSIASRVVGVTDRHRGSPVVETPVLRAVVGGAVIAPRTICVRDRWEIQVLRHPFLPTDVHGPIDVAVTRIGHGAIGDTGVPRRWRRNCLTTSRGSAVAGDHEGSSSKQRRNSEHDLIGIHTGRRMHF